MAEKDSTNKEGKSDAHINLAGEPEKLEPHREKLYMEISKEAIEKYEGLPVKKRRALVKRYKARRWTNTDLATVFSVRERTIERDLAAIRKTLWGDVQTDEGARKLLEEIQADLRMVDDEIVREAWQLFTKTNNDPVKVSCLKLIGERQADVLKALQSLGMLKKAPDKLEIEATTEVKIDINDKIKGYADTLDKLAKKRARKDTD